MLFGDPNDGDAFPGTLNNNVVTYCDPDDLICDGFPIVTDAHGNYEVCLSEEEGVRDEGWVWALGLG